MIPCRDLIFSFIQFDEVLKVGSCLLFVQDVQMTLNYFSQYCNELSMTIELDTTLAQAEVLYLSFSTAGSGHRPSPRRGREPSRSEGDDGPQHTRASETSRCIKCCH